MEAPIYGKVEGMGKPRLVLHIGTEKTGTTHTQMFLKQNRERLAEFGIALGEGSEADYSTYRASHNIWPDRHVGFLIETQADLADYQAKYFETIENLANCGADTVFLSHEMLAKLPPEKTVPFYQKLSSYFDSVTVICYFRRPDDFSSSYYSLSVWKNETLPPTDEFVRTHKSSFDEQAMIRNWAQFVQPDSFVAFPYLSSFKKDDFLLIKRFLTILGVPESEQDPEKWNVPKRRINVRSSAVVTEYLRQLNPYAPRYSSKTDVWNIRQRRQLRTKLNKKFPGDPVRVPKATIDFVLKAFPPSEIQEAALVSTSPEWDTPEFRQEWDEWLAAPVAKSADTPVVTAEQVEAVKQELFGPDKLIQVGGDNRSKARRKFSQSKAKLRKKFAETKK